MHRALRLTIDSSALADNWSTLSQLAGVPAGAAIKANAYGLGAREALHALHSAGCRDFFVSTWAEAEELGPLPAGARLAVLHGFGPSDLDSALALDARPVLNSVEQAERWKAAGAGRACDAMVDTGMNRLGLRPEECGVLAGLNIEVLHSHLACADEDSALNALQLRRFSDVAAQVAARRYSLANSAGIFLGPGYSFDLVRPGLALYGGIPRAEAAGTIRSAIKVEAQVVQRRKIRAGESCGYGATFVAETDTDAAILNIGYADGYLRGFSSRGVALVPGHRLPVLGRVSMDLIAISCDCVPALAEGDWVELDYDLPAAAGVSGLSQYELLTTLGSRFERRWI